MRVPPYIRRAVNAWIAWRAHRSLARAIPALVALDSAERENCRRHRSGVREIASQRRALVTERLMHELGRA